MEKTVAKKPVKKAIKAHVARKPRVATAKITAQSEVTPTPKVAVTVIKPGLPASATTKALQAGKYIEAIGRRKTAIARVRLSKPGSSFLVNGKDLSQYFLDPSLQIIAKDALSRMESLAEFSISARLKGGGLHAQAEALRHGISRALVEINPDSRKKL